MKKKLQIGILFFTFLILCFLVFYVRYSIKLKHDLDGILDYGRLTVITENSSVGFVNRKDSIYGFQYEIIKAFADSLGVELVVTQENDYRKCVNSLLKRDCNIIANVGPLTTQWKNEVLFTDPIYTSHQVLVQRQYNDSSKVKFIHKQNELANDSVFIPSNSPYRLTLENLSNDIAAPISIVENKNSNQEKMVALVSQGKIKNTICEYQLAVKLQSKYTNIDISLPIGFAQQQVWAVHPESVQLIQKLNEFLYDFVGSSDYWKIYNKYYK